MKIFQNSAIVILCSFIGALFAEQLSEELNLTSSDKPKQALLFLDKNIEIKCYEIFKLSKFYDAEFYVPAFFSTEIKKSGSDLIIDLTTLNINFEDKWKICITTNDDNYIWSEAFIFNQKEKKIRIA